MHDTPCGSAMGVRQWWHIAPGAQKKVSISLVKSIRDVSHESDTADMEQEDSLDLFNGDAENGSVLSSDLARTLRLFTERV